MFDRIKAMFAKKDVIDSLQTTVDELQHQLALLNEARSAEAAKKKEEEFAKSTSPWVDIKSAGFSEQDGFRIELDWNDLFIKQLKESGIDGPSDEIIIQKWLAFLYDNLAADLNEHSEQEKDARGASSHYE